MTIKEVLDWLYRIKSKLTMYFPVKWVSECEQAIDYAIKALENQKTLLEELEEIKAKLKKYANHEVIAISGGEESGLDIAIGVLENHIKELKGENNG